MNIYFSGIGGVGLGPLAEIARDAGYDVCGSDPKESLMTKQMGDQGVQISTDQTGAFLRDIHAAHPIDWFVYTSALPADHPELLLAKQLGIKATKRDELLAHIIAEKNLKLIAVAGTHGKTTTTSLLVWTLQQLGIPVSYSIGTTIPFGPSGKFDPASEYFVYECDEYDRNFLQFQPYLSIIPSLTYDHPDTYPTKDSYMAAFHQFLQQSEGSIIWQREAQQLGDVPNSWVLQDSDKATLTLHGEHIRQNASLVIKALERLGINGDSVDAINHFPGVDRRFEQLAPNLYTDYAVHPFEIAATLAMARELNDDVVLVYQPHQNVRQHEVKDHYTTDTFKDAADVYWLPTYLTREDPNLATLTAKDLTKNITGRDIHFAELDTTLWADIQRARDRGALVLVMGAGTIDGWVRTQLNVRHYGNVILVDPAGHLVLQQRDDKPGIANPGGIDIFGGSAEPSDTSLIQTAARELHEETNASFTIDDLKYFRLYHYPADSESDEAYIAYYGLDAINTAALEVYEGQGYVTVSPDDIDAHNLPPFVRTVITDFIAWR